MLSLPVTVLTLLLSAETAPLPVVPPQSRNTLSLEEALASCDDHQPQLVQALANTVAAQARVQEARGAWLPQLSGNAGLVYTGYFGNGSASGSAVISGGGGSQGSSGAVVNGGGGRTTLGVTAYQLIYDFNQTLNRIRSNQAAVAEYQRTQDETMVTTHLGVRSAYYNTRALKALQDVAHDTLENEKQHLKQTEGQIRVGTQPEIALATEKATCSNDVYQMLLAIGNYGIGKSQLNQAMGIEGSTDYEVVAVDAPEVGGEEQSIDALMERALKTRPAYLSVLREIDAQTYLIASYKGNLLPNVFLQGGLLTFGTRPSNFSGDVYGELEVSWPFFNWTNISDIQEQKADLLLYQGQRDQLRQQIRVDVDTARLQVLTYKGSVQAAQDTEANTKDQLQLAEGRYKSGIGNVIELGDAQVAYTNSQVQEVQAKFNLNNARATLMAKLGEK